MATLAVVQGGASGTDRQDALFDLGPGAHQCWYPVALSAQVPQGKVVGRDLADGRIVIYRGEDGVARAMSAYCRHMGADLSFGGEVIGSNIRCPFHHWEWGDGGECKHIPSGDSIPRGVNLFEFPIREQFGLIWVFFGHEPFYEVQTFDDFDPATQVYRSFEIDIPEGLWIEPWVFTTNVYDLVHLRFLHNIIIGDTPIEEVGPHRYRMSWDADMGDKANGNWRPEIETYGINGIRSKGDQGGRQKWYLAASTPLGREGTKFFLTFITTKDEGADDFFERQRATHTAIMREDAPILNNLRMGDFHLVKSDKALMEFLRRVPKYPRTTFKELEKTANKRNS